MCKMWTQMADISNALNIVMFSIAWALLLRIAALDEVLITMLLYMLLAKAKSISTRHAYKCSCSSGGLMSSSSSTLEECVVLFTSEDDVPCISTANSVR